jgi:uncharacterized protein with HEPN domain
MKRDAAYLTHVLDSLEKIESIRQEGRDAFMADFRLHDAAIRNFEIIGEAVKNLSDSCKEMQPHVRWKAIAGFRDILIHHYFGIDLDEVWRVIAEETTSLREAVQTLLDAGTA